jgi:thiol-disulfide isomerase/thioredoxin
MRQVLFLFVLVLSVSGFSLQAAPQDREPSPAILMTIQVVDESGNPVPGALVGNLLYNNEQPESKLILHGESRAVAQTGDVVLTTDNDGTVKLVADDFFFRDDTRSRPAIAMSGDFSRMGITLVAPGQVSGPITVTLHPTSLVSTELTCSELADRGADVWSCIYVYNQDWPFVEHTSSTSTHQFRLPPGEFRLNTYRADTYQGDRSIVVLANEPQSFTIDLPPQVLVKLEGQPAPELVGIKDWYGGEPVTLAALKGKVVLLDFWGFWCGPCVALMPRTFELHDRYHSQGLVIVGVHDDSVADANELREMLAPIKKAIWSDRDIPFAVAIDGGGSQEVPGRDRPVQGMTTAAYGVPAWPTYVLIDRAGNIKGKFRPKIPEDLKLLESLLAAPEP